jgi:hypothetical protein
MRLGSALVIYILVSLLFPLAALGAGSVSGAHSPLIALKGGTVTIKARASHPERIKFLTLKMIVGRLAECGVLDPQKKGTGLPCRTDAATFSHVCEFGQYDPPGSEIDCSYSANFGALAGGDALVSYQVSATHAANDGTLSEPLITEEVTFAQGVPSNFSGAVIAWPIWWHRQSSLTLKVDLGIFKDPDYGSSDVNFANSLNLILNNIDSKNLPYALPLSAGHDLFNMWMFSQGGDAKPPCERKFKPMFDPVLAWLDGKVILHQQNFPDCSSISWSGGGSVFGASADATWIFMHEMGHFLFGQGDEYACGGTFVASERCKNVFLTKDECEAASTASACEPVVCNNITRAWHFHSEGDIIMRDQKESAEWSPVNQSCVSRRNSKRRWPIIFFRELVAR